MTDATELPEGIPRKEVEEMIKTACNAVVENIVTLFPTGARTRKQSVDKDKTRNLMGNILQTLEVLKGGEWKTYGELRTAAKKAHARIHALKPQMSTTESQYLDERVWKQIVLQFDGICDTIRQRVRDALPTENVNSATHIELLMPARYVALVMKQFHTTNVDRLNVLIPTSPDGKFVGIKSLKKTPLVSGSERVSAKGADLFGNFILALSMAIESVRENEYPDVPTVQFALIQKINELMVNDTSAENLEECEKIVLTSEWIKHVLPGRIQRNDLQNMAKTANLDLSEIPYLDIDMETGNSVIIAEAILMPKKWKHFSARREPDAMPLWRMTSEEASVLDQFWKDMGGKDGTNFYTDGTFLANAANKVNERCNGNMKLVRPYLEIKSYIEYMEMPAVRRTGAQPEKNGSDTPVDAVVAYEVRPTVTPVIAEEVFVARNHNATLQGNNGSTSDTVATVNDTAFSSLLPAGNAQSARMSVEVAPISLPIEEPVTAPELSADAAVSVETLNPFAAKAAEAVASVSDFAERKIKYVGDFATRLLIQKIYTYVKDRQSTLQSSPESATAFDAFAVEFLRLFKLRGTVALMHVDKRTGNVASSQVPQHYVRGANLLLEDLRTYVPAGSGEKLKGDEAEEFLKAISACMEMTGPLSQKMQRYNTHNTTGSRLFSEFTLIQIHPILAEAARSLQQTGQFTAEAHENYIESILQICEALMSCYQLNTNNNSLEQQDKSADFEKAISLLLGNLQKIMTQKEGESVSTSTPADPSVSSTALQTPPIEEPVPAVEHAEQDAPEPAATPASLSNESFQNVELGAIPAPIAPAVVTVSIVDSVNVTDQTLTMTAKRDTLAPQISVLEEGIAQRLQSTYQDLSAMIRKLDSMNPENDDPQLTEWSTTLLQQSMSIQGLTTQEIVIDHTKKATVKITEIAQAIHELQTRAEATVTTVQADIAQKDNMKAELGNIEQQLAILEEIDTTQKKLREQIEALQALQTTL